MEEKVFQLIAEVLNLDREKLRENYNNEAIWDSIQRVEILFSIEDEYTIVFGEEELVALNTPRKLVEAVARKVQ